MSRALGLAVGYAADRILGDPARHHPVAGFGQLAAGLERRMYADSRARGAAYTLVLVGSTAALGTAVDHATRGRPALHTLATAATTWAVLGGASLGREATALRGQLAAGDLVAARAQLTHRRPGHQRARHRRDHPRNRRVARREHLGRGRRAAAGRGVRRIGGLAGYPRPTPSTRWSATAALGIDTSAGPRPGWTTCSTSRRPGSPRGWRRRRADGRRLGRNEPSPPGGAMPPTTPAPNAGPVEASFAGALGVTLGGRNTYGERVEVRNTLGDGPPPEIRDIERAHQLADRVGAAALAISVVLALRPTRRRRRVADDLDLPGPDEWMRRAPYDDDRSPSRSAASIFGQV